MADAPYLPDHIITQIFLRLPIKPLCRFKCLSKHWKRTISDPKFIKSRSRRMIFLPCLPPHAIDNTGTPSMIKLSSPLINPESYKQITIVGSFNGAFLLVLKYCNPIIIDHHIQCDDHMILYNPLSREFKTVPHPPLFDSHSKYVYGYGYGSTEDDLKIVRLKNDSKCYDVFDLKTWSWSGPSEFIRSNRTWGIYSGTFANGFLYWKAERRMYSRPSILALDIKNMVFSEKEYPDGCYRLGTYNGRLCTLCHQVKGYELRVMNEHGFGESWSTVCSLTSSFKSLISLSSNFGDLCILDDGKLLMPKPPKEVIIYYMFKDSYEVVNALTSFVRVGRLQSAKYVESLLSPSEICSAFV